jgi:molecular chaperone GrpE (heat shock protein)
MASMGSGAQNATTVLRRYNMDMIELAKMELKLVSSGVPVPITATTASELINHIEKLEKRTTILKERLNRLGQEYENSCNETESHWHQISIEAYEQYMELLNLVRNVLKLSGDLEDYLSLIKYVDYQDVIEVEWELSAL